MLELSSDAAPSTYISQLYETYKGSTATSTRPNRERAVVILKQELACFPRTFIIIDALDEYRVSNASAQQQLVQELETFNASLLFTSRHPVAFRLGASTEIGIRASPVDVKMCVTEEMGKGLLTMVFRGQPRMAQEVMDTIVEHTDGMYVLCLGRRWILPVLTSFHQLPLSKAIASEYG